LIYLFNVLFCKRVLSYFAKPNFIVYDEWFDNDLKKAKLNVKNKKITNISNIYEFFYEQSNYKVGASENNLQIDINENREKLFNNYYFKNNSEKKLQDAIFADERAIDLACRFGYSIPNAYKSLGGALKELIEKTRKKKKRSFFEDRLDALRKSAEIARSELSQQEGSEKSVSSENVYGQ